ncbi:undecaprenyl-phosphate galactose phosphotransferase [Arthrobacter sp. PAMC 25486]|uniref:sugar transferase n=1 Tax=Arthrobacter sp. PAMC 25486 TaxID=1494608 RepID=UPI000535D2D2|nr:sugar transferase [Arthrobacter sp. PAMC 25486]AIY03607.1 undecaprenyl-phosphate galactose phosphotransferase [Arthrobacter sp. PAMC 25486]
MTELRILPHLRRPVVRPANVKDKGSAPRAKHSVWDAHTVLTSARSSNTTWSARYATTLRLSDALVSIAVVAAAYLLRFGIPALQDSSGLTEIGYVWVGLAIVVLWNLDLAYCRSREKGVFGAGVTEYRRVVQATLRTFGIMAIILLVFQVDVSRGFFAAALPLGIVLIVGERWLWRRWLSRQRSAGKSLSKVVVLGNPQDVEYVIGQLRDNLSTGYKVAGVALTTLQPNMELLPPWYGVPVLSTAADIADVVAKTGAEAVLVAGALPGGPKAIQELGWRLEDMATELVLSSSLTNVAGPRVHFRPMEGLPLMHVELPQYSGGKHVFKRVMDVALAAAAMAVLLPVFLVLALTVKLDSPGPALFFQERVGRNGKMFKMVKFRSMVVDAEEKLASLHNSNEGAGFLFKMANDPRVTRCGHWMRRFSLDELPQFWNVLLGHMSLVGPRPPLAREVAEYQQPVHRRLLIKPGITGLWQINGRSDLVWDEAVRLDLYYVENWSLTGDIVILWRTFKAVVAPVGAY